MKENKKYTDNTGLQSITESIIESANTGMILVNSSLTIMYLNPSAENLLQTSANRLTNQSIDKLNAKSIDLSTPLNESLRTNQPYTQREIQWCIAPNSIVTLDLTVTPLIASLVEHSTETYLLLELRRLDRFLKISKEESIWSTHQASKALIRGLAHEVKNPLGGIRGAAQLLAKTMGSNEEITDYTQIIIDEADRLRALVDRMLGPKSPPKFQKENIHEVLERVKSLLDAETNFAIDIVRDYDLSLPLADADINQLIQAVLNVGRNAVQAILEAKPTNIGPSEKNSSGTNGEDYHHNPKIIFRTRVVRQQTIHNTRHRLTIRITIEDNGPGIPKQILETLFYPLVSGRAEGTGLGLAIAQAILQQHHGIIECQSEPGRTQFHLFLPLEDL